MSEKTCPNNIAAHDSLSRVGGSGAGGLGGRAGRRGAAGASPGDGEFLPPEPLRLLSGLLLLLGPGDEPQGSVPQVHMAPVNVADQRGQLELLLPPLGQDSPPEALGHDDVPLVVHGGCDEDSPRDRIEIGSFLGKNLLRYIEARETEGLRRQGGQTGI